MGITFSSCKKQEDLLFPKLSNERVLDLVSDTETALLSSEYGWETTYTTPTKNKFILQFKFLPDHQVMIYSDYDKDPSKSSYKFSASRGAVLTFDSYGILHDLAHPTILTDITVSPGEQEKQKGRGYGGDFEFEILEVTKDTIFMRGIKDQDRITKLARMTKPADANQGVTEATEFVKYLNTSNGYAYKTIDLNGSPVAEFYFSSSKGELVSKTYDKPQFVMVKINEKGEKVTEEIEAKMIENGFELSKPIVINGKEYTTFTRADRHDPFVAKNDPNLVLNINGSIPAIPRPVPVIHQTDHYWQLLNKLWCSDLFRDKIVIPAQKYVNPNMSQIGFFTFTDGPKALYLWGSGTFYRIPFNYIQVKGNVHKFQHLAWIPNKDLYGTEGNGFREFVYYFSDYFVKDNLVIVEDLGNKYIRFISGIDSRVWFTCHL